MANRIKGEVAFSIEDGNLAGEYTLLLDFNALCDLEEDFPGIMEGKFELKSPTAIRKVFAVGLAEHHDLSERDAGKLIHAVGLNRVGELVGEAFAASFPEADKGKPRPQKAPAKAGAGSGR